MSRLSAPPGAPAWAVALVGGLNAALAELEQATAPTRVFTRATLAEFPPPERCRDRLGVARDTGRLHRSNGNSWGAGVVL